MMETLPSGAILNGRYRVERPLGSGGFGHVYLVVDQRTNQQYAAKEYLVTGANGQEQLQHEAQVLSQLHHPNLPLFQNAFNDHGRYYVVISYIEGNDLTDLIRTASRRNEVVPISRLISWLLAVCDAVNFLHSQRTPVIHRDIKPDNIRIMPDERAILVDLGNAKEADGARTLFFIRHQGTPGYAPQEQYPGGKGTDERSDIYALGGTLYFVLTAREPPSVSTRNQALQQNLPDLPSLQEQLAKNPPEVSAEASAEKQFRLGVSKPAKPPPRHSRHLAQLGTIPLEVLNQLDRIIKHAMAMRQRDRYQSVAEFSADLRKIAAALPPPPPPPGAALPENAYSTQPDLPLLYEAIEAAKAQADQKPTTPPPSPKDTPAPTPSAACPYCRAPLLQQASFCPSCGKPLTSRPQGSSINAPSSNPQSKPHTNPPQNRVMARNISAEPTMVITPQAQAQMRGSASAPKPSPSPSASSNKLFLPPAPSSQNRAASPSSSPLPPRSFLPPTPLSTAAPASVNGISAPQAPTNASDLQPLSSDRRPWIIIIGVAVALIVLLIIILFIMSNKG